jgi:hypothetical protein
VYDQAWSWRLCALAWEACALGAALVGHIATACALHALCAFWLAYASADGQLRSHAALALSVGGWALCTPVLGPLGLCLVVLPAFRKRRALPADGVVELELGALDPELKTHDAHHAPIVDVLLGRSGQAQRIAAVMALRRIELARAVPLLRVALLDADEDVRLLAYALLERREKQLRAKIETGLRELAESEKLDTPAHRGPILHALCVNHWALLQAGFVSGPAAESTLRAAVRYGSAALRLRTDGALAVLLACVQLRAGDAVAAIRYLNEAGATGTAPSVLSPLYAKAAFELRRFESVGPLLAGCGGAALVNPQHAALVDFWSGRERP